MDVIVFSLVCKYNLHRIQSCLVQLLLHAVTMLLANLATILLSFSSLMSLIEGEA